MDTVHAAPFRGNLRIRHAQDCLLSGNL